MALGMYSEPFDLPHPPVDVSIYRIFEEGVQAAWKMLREYPPADFDISEETGEVKINFRLQEAIIDRVWNQGVVDGFDEDFFRSIERGPEVCDFEEKMLEKRPDMLARLTGRPQSAKPSQDGIFVECKPIDSKRPLTTAYCKAGVRRFIDGRYAWAMQDAMMIGYPASAMDIVAELDSAFETTRAIVTHRATPVLDHRDSEIAVSSHARSFNYPTTGEKASDIIIRHLWLERTI